MPLKLYSKYCIDVEFNEEPLGFSIGKTVDGFPVVKSLQRKPNGNIYPLEGCCVIQTGDYIISINNDLICLCDPKEIRSIIHNKKKPYIIRFAKPCAKHHWKNILSLTGEVRIQKWGDSDLYLPVRYYKLGSMTYEYMSRRYLDDTTSIWKTPLFPSAPLFECDIREAAFNQINDQSTRALIWKLLLHCYSMYPSRWQSDRNKNIEEYNSFLKEFITSKNAKIGKPNCDFIPNPMDTTWKKDVSQANEMSLEHSNESVWSREFGDSSLREIIWKDTERTYKDHPLFHERNKQKFARLLYVYSQLNRGIEYVQGMNELLAPLIIVFYEAEEGNIDMDISIAVEADAFFTFTNLMTEIRDLFIQQLDDSTNGLQGSFQLLENYIHLFLPQQQLHLVPEIYAVRWLTTLFAREFPLYVTFILWDHIFGDPSRYMFVYCIATAILKHFEDRILNSDFGEIASSQSLLDLQKYMEKSIRVKFFGGREVVGILKGYDALMNIVLDDCVEYLRDPEDNYSLSDESRELGTVICRTTGIMSVNPVEGMMEIQNPYEES